MTRFAAAFLAAFSMIGHHDHKAHKAHKRPKAHKVHKRPFSTAFVSWYDDETGQTASGVHDYYGFAACGDGDCVPMGTKIEFCARRCVTAIRDDSGPYVPGRAFDLNQNVASAIGFDGLGDVRYRVIG